MYCGVLQNSCRFFFRAACRQNNANKCKFQRIAIIEYVNPHKMTLSAIIVVFFPIVIICAATLRKKKKYKVKYLGRFEATNLF
jgi:hypothetical protein